MAALDIALRQISPSKVYSGVFRAMQCTVRTQVEQIYYHTHFSNVYSIHDRGHKRGRDAFNALDICLIEREI